MLMCLPVSATLRDVYAITSLSPHPCGDFLYVGTAHPIVRLYDLNTLRAFASLRAPGAVGASGASAHQRGPLTDIRPSQDGSVLAAASEDGSIHVSRSTLKSKGALKVYFTVTRLHLAACGFVAMR